MYVGCVTNIRAVVYYLEEWLITKIVLASILEQQVVVATSPNLRIPLLLL